MKLLIYKYQKRFGILFLSIYLSFVFVGTLHHHKYDFECKNTYSDSFSKKSVNDLSVDFFSVCSLHQFAQTLDNFHYSSSDIIQSLSTLESNLFLTHQHYSSSEEYSSISPRAPPLSISWINNNLKANRCNKFLREFCK